MLQPFDVQFTSTPFQVGTHHFARHHGSCFPRLPCSWLAGRDVPSTLSRIASEQEATKKPPFLTSPPAFFLAAFFFFFFTCHTCRIEEHPPVVHFLWTGKCSHIEYKCAYINVYKKKTKATLSVNMENQKNVCRHNKEKPQRGSQERLQEPE